MCGSIEYQRELIYLPNRDARLPVQLNNGNVLWVIWGKYKKEANRDFFNGGRVHIESIHAGKWKLWHPRLLSIAADQFMEKDQDGLLIPE